MGAGQSNNSNSNNSGSASGNNNGNARNSNSSSGSGSTGNAGSSRSRLLQQLTGSGSGSGNSNRSQNNRGESDSNQNTINNLPPSQQHPFIPIGGGHGPGFGINFGQGPPLIIRLGDQYQGQELEGVRGQGLEGLGGGGGENGGAGPTPTTHWCHQCNKRINLTPDGSCPDCNGGFVEEAPPPLNLFGGQGGPGGENPGMRLLSVLQAVTDLGQAMEDRDRRGGGMGNGGRGNDEEEEESGSGDRLSRQNTGSASQISSQDTGPGGEPGSGTMSESGIRGGGPGSRSLRGRGNASNPTSPTNNNNSGRIRIARGGRAGGGHDLRIEELLRELTGHLRMAENMRVAMHMSGVTQTPEQIRANTSYSGENGSASSSGNNGTSDPSLSPLPDSLWNRFVTTVTIRNEQELKEKCNNKGASLEDGTGESAEGCAICCCELFEDEEVEISRITPCGHEFHKDCLKAWFARASSCPICRIDLKEYASKFPSSPTNQSKSGPIVAGPGPKSPSNKLSINNSSAKSPGPNSGGPPPPTSSSSTGASSSTGR